MDNQRNKIPYTYAQAGFNNFLSRSIDSRPALTLREASSTFKRMNTQEVNFDQQQTSGTLGDVIQVGDILIDGRNRLVDIQNEGRTETLGRFGNLDA